MLAWSWPRNVQNDMYTVICCPKCNIKMQGIFFETLIESGVWRRTHHWWSFHRLPNYSMYSPPLSAVTLMVLHCWIKSFLLLGVWNIHAMSCGRLPNSHCLSQQTHLLYEEMWDHKDGVVCSFPVATLQEQHIWTCIQPELSLKIVWSVKDDLNT